RGAARRRWASSPRRPRRRPTRRPYPAPASRRATGTRPGTAIRCGRCSPDSGWWRRFARCARDAQVHLSSLVVGVQPKDVFELGDRLFVLTRGQVEHAEQNARLEVARVRLLCGFELVARPLQIARVSIKDAQARAEVGERRTEGDGFLELADRFERHTGVL